MKIKESSDKIVILAGSFDPVDSDHIRLIRDAAEYGTVYILLHSDLWVKRKLHKRVTPWGERAQLLHEFQKVAKVIDFNDLTGTLSDGFAKVRKMHPTATITYYSATPSDASTNVPEQCEQYRIKFVAQYKFQPGAKAESQAPRVELDPTQPINIVCLKWGTKYGSDYVNKLYSAVKRNTTVPFKFHCFTDDSTDIRREVKVHPLAFTDLQTWWNKLYLFSNQIDIPLGEKIFYVDLDTLITGSLDSLLQVNAKKLVALKDFYAGIARTASTMGSGLMAWTHGKYTNVWEEFRKDPAAAIKMMHPHGDQKWIERMIPLRAYWQDLYPTKVVSFKVHCKAGLPSGATVVCYHGAPSIPESISQYTKDWKWSIPPAPWVAKYWKDDVPRFSVRYVELDPSEIFGMVGRCGGGYNTVWEDWSQAGRKKREYIIAAFEEGLNKICGHYQRLEQSILKEGLRNPLVITCGLPRKRDLKHLPPEMLALPPQDLLLLEGTAGGSRLWAAQKLGIKVPCIVNDWHGRFDDCPEIVSPEDARKYFKDQPALVKIDPKLGFIEGFDTKKVGHHLGFEWSEEKLVIERAPLWVGLMNKYGYRVERLPAFVNEILAKAGIKQP